MLKKSVMHVLLIFTFAIITATISIFHEHQIMTYVKLVLSGGEPSKQWFQWVYWLAAWGIISLVKEANAEIKKLKNG